MNAEQRDRGPLVVGGEPRIDFLPTETKKRKENRRSRRSLVFLVVMVAIVCAVGFYFSTLFAGASQAALKSEQDKTQTILKKQQEFSDVRGLQIALATAEDARKVGTATEILWDDYQDDIFADLPPGSGLLGVAVESMSATDSVPEVIDLLEKPRIATLTLTFAALDVQTADAILVALQKQDFYADSTIPTISWDREKQWYVVTSVLHITPDAFARRFFTAQDDSDASAETPDEEPTPTPTDTPTPTSSPTPGTEG